MTQRARVCVCVFAMRKQQNAKYIAAAHIKHFYYLYLLVWLFNSSKIMRSKRERTFFAWNPLFGTCTHVTQLQSEPHRWAEQTPSASGAVIRHLRSYCFAFDLCSCQRAQSTKNPPANYIFHLTIRINLQHFTFYTRSLLALHASILLFIIRPIRHLHNTQQTHFGSSSSQSSVEQ